MASRKIYDMAVKVGSYTDRNGNSKATWENIGGIYEAETQNGISRYIRMKATFNPSGVDRQQGQSDILISLFTPKEKN